MNTSDLTIAINTKTSNYELYVLIPECLIGYDQTIIDQYAHCIFRTVGKKLLCSDKNSDNIKIESRSVLNYFRTLGLDVDYQHLSVVSYTSLLFFLKIKKRSFLKPFKFESCSFSQISTLQEQLCDFSLSLVNLIDSQSLEAIIKHKIPFENVFDSAIFTRCFESVNSNKFTFV